MQNILPLYQQGADYQRVIMLASSDGQGSINPQFVKIANDLIRALSHPKTAWELYPEPVDPMDPASTESLCRKIIQAADPQERMTINFTGGTKPMSIGAYTAGQACAVKRLYVDTQTETLYHFGHDSMRTEPFNLNPISVESLLNVHGRYLNENGTLSLRKPEYDAWTENLFFSQTQLTTFVDQIQQFTRSLPKELDIDGFYKGVLKAENVPGEIRTKLVRENLATIENGQVFVNKTAYMFLNGGWLESYVWLALKKTSRCMDARCRLKIQDIENELDAACTVQGKLGIIECKSGSLKGPEGQKILGRLKALKDTLGGTFARPFLVTTCMPDDVTEDFKKRAREYSSTIIYLNELEGVGNRIVEALASRKRMGRSI